jgi:hypothetical protein
MYTPCTLRKPASLTGAVLAVLIAALPAKATLVQNGSFENVGSATASFSINNPTLLPGWITSPTPSGNEVLDCLIFAGASAAGPLCSGTLPSGWTPLSFPVMPGPSPDGGNFVAVDGDTGYNTALQQTITGLVTGAEYQVFFYQAAVQQAGYTGTTTEQWQVSLGGTSQTSALMTDASQSDVGWMSQSLIFTANASSQVLSFLALGTPAGEPPFVLLDGVSMAQVAEPGTSWLIGLGLLSIPIARRLLLLKKRD